LLSEGHFEGLFGLEHKEGNEWNAKIKAGQEETNLHYSS
jgi:hypothetical protein